MKASNEFIITLKKGNLSTDATFVPGRVFILFRRSQDPADDLLM